MKGDRTTFTICVVMMMAMNCHAGDEDSEPEYPGIHRNRPRFISVFSRPHPEAEKQVGVGFKQHVSNVLGGGSIGLNTEFRPLAPVHGFLNKAKKLIPQPPGIFGGFEPSGIIPGGKGKVPEVFEPAGKIPEDKGKVPDVFEPAGKIPEDKGKVPDIFEPEVKPGAGNIESEEMVDEGSKEPVKPPKKNLPTWDDIGGDSDYDSVPFLDVINPRRRPKRFIESKVYHVPIEFVSNAKPVHVKVQSRNV